MRFVNELIASVLKLVKCFHPSGTILEHGGRLVYLEVLGLAHDHLLLVGGRGCLGQRMREIGNRINVNVCTFIM